MKFANMFRELNSSKRTTRFVFILMGLIVGAAFNVNAAKEDCTNLDGDGPKPIQEVDEEDVRIQNDYDDVIEEDDRRGVVYLALIGGRQPKANACGLIPKNPRDAWTGWGGPLNLDNVTIGEGPDARNHIVIGGTLFERGIGVHAIGTLVYDLTDDKYLKFEGYIGISDETDPGWGWCNDGGSSEFTFSLDGKEVFRSDVITGVDDDGENVEAVKVEFDIPSDAKELTIIIGDGNGDDSCDHAIIGDAKLLTAQGLAVEPTNKLPTIWGHLKRIN